MDIQEFLAQKQIMVPFSMAAALLGLTPHGVRALVARGHLDEMVVTTNGQVWRGVTGQSLSIWAKQLRPSGQEMVSVERAIKARKGELLAYNDLLLTLGLDYHNPAHRRRLEEILAQLSRYSQEHSGYMLWAAVVMKATGQPAKGFYSLAREIWKGAHDLSDGEIWAKQLKRLKKRME